jgi:hypothetical protein
MIRGDPLIACAPGNQIHLYQLDSSSGTCRESLLPLPDCQAGHPAVLFLVVHNNGG